MKIVTFCAATGVLTAWASAEPTLPEMKDREGNHAVSVHVPREFQAALPSTRFDPSWSGFGPGGANVRSVAASPTAAGIRIAGVTDSFGSGQLYRSTDNGNFWQAIPETGTRGINEVQFAANGHAYAATQDGLFKSTDDGVTWAQVALPGVENANLVQSVSTDPTNSQTVWVGLGQYLNGTSTQLIVRSVDGGATWTDVSPAVTFGFGTTALAVDPANGSRVYAAFSGAFGAENDVWVTTDGGVTWNERSTGLPDNIVWGFAFAPGAAYVVGGQDFGSQFVGLFRTADDGANWTELSTLDWPNRAVTAVAVDPGNASRLLVGTQRAGLGVSTDAGATWTFSAGGSGQFPVNDIAFVPGQPNSIFLAMGSIAMLRSGNGGGTFQTAADGINRVSVTSIAVNPNNSSEIALSYAGDNDGGIFGSTDGGQTWTLDTNAPLPRWQTVVFGPNGTLYAAHDGPLGRADDGVWVRNIDGTWTGIGPGTPGVLDTEGKSIAVSTGASPVILFGGNEGFFGGYDAVIHTFNRGGSGAWEKSYEAGAIQSEHVSSFKWLNNGAGPEAVASVVNFGFENGGAGGILRSTDSGQSWARSETGYPTAWHAWMLSSRDSEPNTLYTTASEFTFSNINNRVFKSVDGGITWNDQSLADTLPFRKFIVDPELPGRIYASNLNDGRVQISEDDGATFTSFSNGLLGPGGGSAFAYDPAQRRLLYGTTAGAFKTPLEPIGCPADLDNGSGTGTRDGGVDINDLLYFLVGFEAGDVAVDLDNGTGSGTPDGGVDINDLLYFLVRFEAGC